MKNNQITETMIQLIDKRVQKYISTMNVVTQYAGVVTEKLGENSYKVRLAGSENNFTFGNKTNQDLNIGDSVYIQTIGNDLNTGIIIASFKPYINNTEVYPVGSLYFSIYDIYPGNLFGGKWERIKDRFLLGAGDTYNAGDTGGRSEVTLSANIGACNNSPNTLGYITENPTDYQYNNSANYVVSGSNNNFAHWNHSTPVTESTSNNRNTNILPPYLVVFMWKRIG